MQILIIAQDKIIVIIMDNDIENNDIILGGVDAPVYLAGTIPKKCSTLFVWGYPFSTYLSYDQFFNPLPLARICTHLE